MFGNASQQSGSADASSLFASSAGSSAFEAPRAPTSHHEEHSFHGAIAHDQTSYGSASNFFGSNSSSPGGNDFSSNFYGNQHTETHYGGSAVPAEPAETMFATGSNYAQETSAQSATQLFGSSAIHTSVEHSYSNSSFHSQVQNIPAPELSRKESASSVFSTQSAHSTSFDQGHYHREPAQQPARAYSQPPHGAHNEYETNEYIYATSRQGHQSADAALGFSQVSADAGSFFAASSASSQETQQTQDEVTTTPSADSFFGQNSSIESSTNNWFENASDNSPPPPAPQPGISKTLSTFDEQRHNASAESGQLSSSVETTPIAEFARGEPELSSVPDGHANATKAQAGTSSLIMASPSDDAYDTHETKAADEFAAPGSFTYGEKVEVDAFALAPPVEPAQSDTAEFPAESENASPDVQENYDAQQGFENTESTAEHANQWGGDLQQQQTTASSLFDSSVPADESSPFGNSEPSSSLFSAPPPQGGEFGQPNDFFASGPPANGSAGFFNGEGYGTDAYGQQTQQQQFGAQVPTDAYARPSSATYNAQEHYGQVQGQHQQFHQQQYQNQQSYEQAQVSQPQDHEQYQVPHTQDQAYSTPSQRFQANTGGYVQGFTPAHAQQFQQQPGQVQQFPSSHSAGVSRTYGRTTFNTGASSTAKASPSPMAATTVGVAHSPMVKTSTKYKDPSRVAPSCLVAFGFGGNIATMFPKRKLLLNIAGSSFRNSPRPAVYVLDSACFFYQDLTYCMLNTPQAVTNGAQ